MDILWITVFIKITFVFNKCVSFAYLLSLDSDCEGDDWTLVILFFLLYLQKHDVQYFLKYHKLITTTCICLECLLNWN